MMPSEFPYGNVVVAQDFTIHITRKLISLHAYDVRLSLIKSTLSHLFSPCLPEINAHEQQHPAVSVAMVAASEVGAPNQYTSVFEDEELKQFSLHPHDAQAASAALAAAQQAASQNNSNGGNPNPNPDVPGGGSVGSAGPWGNTDPDLDWTNLDQVPPGGGGPNNNPMEIKEQSIDEEVDKYFKDNSPDDNNQKLSQLRTMLVEKLKSPSGMVGFKPTKSPGAGDMNSWNPNVNNATTAESILTPAGPQPSLSTRRRVSFIVQDPHQPQNGGSVVLAGGSGMGNGQGVVPNGPGPSPGTRKRHCSFQPISPRQASLPQSPSASPFISPRSTPVHMMRSRHSSGSALPLHMLPQGTTKGPFGSSGSDISRAATFGSASECSTPFISPHGTPIPFNRSRHNSAQGRLCRSRHSSGVAPYR